MTADRWEFWIDVGGTFTDCFARRPDGELLRHKLLSSGVTRGVVGTSSTRDSILDPARAGEPASFWSGSQLRLLGTEPPAAAVVAEHDAARGELKLQTALTSQPRAGREYELVSSFSAPVLAIRRLLGLAAAEPMPAVGVRLGTTIGTNALLTRREAQTALVTTRGFGDVLAIGYQDRPQLFELGIRKPPPLAAKIIEIDERIAADGAVLQPLDERAIAVQLEELRASGAASLAVCLLHACANPAHEEIVERLARAAGFQEISLSSRTAAIHKFVPRCESTVADAYLSPVLRRYVLELRSQLPGSDLRLLTSAGGLVDAANFSGKDSILSGPAGGVVGYSHVAKAAGYKRAVGFDMGGTSTDVWRDDGRLELDYENEKAGVRLAVPMLAIETVAAGGGSICRFDGSRLLVGPESAGAEPGPACHGRGGPLALTDCNVWLGRVPIDRFPFLLDMAAVHDRLTALLQEVHAAGLVDRTLDSLAEGFVRVANVSMAQAIRGVTVAKGYDVRDYPLVAFGGAAGQHACAVAAELGMSQIVCPADAGLLSALGVGLADVERHRAVALGIAYNEQTLRELKPTLARLGDDAVAEVVAEGISAEHIEAVQSLDIRYQGVDAAINIAQPLDNNFAAAFEREHRRLHGYVYEGRALEIVAARVVARGRSATALPESRRVAPPREGLAQRHRLASATVCFAGERRAAPLVERAQLLPGDRLVGPAIVCESTSTAVIDPGWQAEVLSQGELVLTPIGNGTAKRQLAAQTSLPDPVLLEVFNRRLMGIAERMGHALRATASSVNVKERLDYSCAVFTAEGQLAAAAAHIPVHLGAMADTVQAVLHDNPKLRPGDVVATNDPYRGGSHLPDVTVVSPQFDAQGRLAFFVANRAHHAEIGGIVPGSMPAHSRSLAEEGVLISNFKLVEAGCLRADELAALLAAGPFPSRDVPTNLADIAAQVAANRQGECDLAELVAEWTLPVVADYMRHLQAAAERATRRTLARFAPGTRRFVDYLDDGSQIAVSVSLLVEKAVVDFTGTGPVLAGNLNANRSIVRAALMYVLRCLIDEDLPLNHGMLLPVELVLPECLLNPPAHERAELCAAVAGGNVETSQRVVDVLLAALEMAAASQGTMNNVSFGSATFGYYETICGGEGATPSRDGADAVHTHMTNTRLTDPEVLERRAPVRVCEFSVRRGSGGAGLHRGGDGAVRAIEFLAPLEVSILSQRRGKYPPPGLGGGAPGAIGRNTLRRTGGTVEQLGGTARFSVLPGDVLVIETPGGGGWGTPQT